MFVVKGTGSESGSLSYFKYLNLLKYDHEECLPISLENRPSMTLRLPCRQPPVNMFRR